MVSVAHYIAIQGKHHKKVTNNPTNYFLGCVLMYKGRVISTAFNDGINHAEALCIKKANIKKIEKCEILVIRLSNNNFDKFLCSRPCSHCIDVLVKNNITKVWYINLNGDLVWERPKKMEKTHISRGHRLTS